MPLSQLLLLLWVFLLSSTALGWFTVSVLVIGWVGVLYVAIYILEALGVITLNLPLRSSK